ncbi:MAG: hypothetical protein A3J27_14135 [Candidatus Tectomicrobia bacterium RIFCSPLOWO2_12_FULL_69_37]|nr:MAG: hypothetical protein A3J27_14135 [Candidatus Tectomicrobia bacterium RIFCSPLOWO2_12_FULL_69_37]
MRNPIPEKHFGNPHIPYYYQITNLLRRKIELGELPPGSKLPREIDLAKTFGVSCVPIRQALSLLSADGLVLRQRGRGTFVTENARRLKTIRLTGIAEGSDLPGKAYRLLSVKDVPASPQLIDFFGLSAGETLTEIRRLPLMEKKPISYALHYLSAESSRKIHRADLQKRSMLDIITKRLGLRLGKVHQTIEAKMADSDVAAHLSIDVMSPVLYVETFVRSESEKPLEFSQIFYRGDEHKYIVELVPE